MVERVLKYIEKNSLINVGEKLIVGLSGGPDSVCLIHILKVLKDCLSIKIFAVHINHMLRGIESEEDEKYVKILCEKLNIPLKIEHINLNKIAKDNKLSIEEAGREERYKIFNAFSQKIGADKIAVAHNKNDQAETVLMNIIRGTGLYGLKGMDARRDNIIRPLLDIERSEIENYCNEHKLMPQIDSTNLKNIYTRNRIRLDLIPYINEMFDGDIVQKIIKMSDIVRCENVFIEDHVEKLYEQVLVESKDSEIILDLETIKTGHVALRRRVLRKSINQVAGSLKGIENKHIEDIIDLVEHGGVGAMIHLPNKIRIKKSYKTIKIYLYKKPHQIPRYNKKVNIPGDTVIEEDGILLRAEVIDNTGIDNYKNNKNSSSLQYFDYESLIEGINIRKRDNGDKFKPLNSNGTKKLKEYFIDNKIPQEIRDTIPLISKGNEIVWIIGYRINDKYKVTENTKKVLKLQVLRK
ncbi:UNVERIFIED_CONTAM: tRNA(Ile)-lysidine synthase [Acetivibrio alkalicellulosi]